jgi:hypothetical protein
MWRMHAALMLSLHVAEAEVISESAAASGLPASFGFGIDASSPYLACVLFHFWVLIA